MREKAKKRSYDCAKYENQLYRFNTVDRPSCYRHEVSLPGLDHCYDCRAEVHVYEQYLANIDFVKSLCRKGDAKLDELSLAAHLEKLNMHLEANRKLVCITFDKKVYRFKFTDVEFGKRFEDVCNERTLTPNTFHESKWNKQSNFSRFGNFQGERNNTFSFYNRGAYKNAKWDKKGAVKRLDSGRNYGMVRMEPRFDQNGADLKSRLSFPSGHAVNK